MAENDVLIALIVPCFGSLQRFCFRDIMGAHAHSVNNGTVKQLLLVAAASASWWLFFYNNAFWVKYSFSAVGLGIMDVG